MPSYPTKTRSVAAGKPFPARSRSAEVNKVITTKSPYKGSASDGKKPKKGVLTKGGGHG